MPFIGEVPEGNLFNCCINVLPLIITNCKGYEIPRFGGQILQKPKGGQNLDLASIQLSSLD